MVTIYIKVKLVGSLRKDRANNTEFTVEIEEQPTVKELMNKLEIVPEDVGLVIVDGTYAETDTVIHPQARVILLPHIGGG